MDALGWRGACLAYAALHLAVSLPLCLRGLHKEERRGVTPMPAAGRADHPAPAPPFRGPLRDPRFWFLAIAGTVSATLTSIWAVHGLAILEGRGASAAEAVALGTLIGPAQVAGRVLELASGGRHHPSWTGLAATALVALGLAGLVAGLPAGAALLAYGAGAGLWSIARGALPLALFGPDDYAAVMGKLATPMLVASAAAPLLGTWIIASVGPAHTVAVLAAAALLPVTLIMVILVASGAWHGPRARR